MLCDTFCRSQAGAIVCALWLPNFTAASILTFAAGEAVHQAYRNSSALEAALNASTLPNKEALPSASQLQEETPADSNLSDATQGPNWLQRWAALLMPSDSNDQSQASLQQFMTNITVAMQQAQREVMRPTILQSLPPSVLHSYLRYNQRPIMCAV